jgi:hypothetical protein
MQNAAESGKTDAALVKSEYQPTFGTSQNGKTLQVSEFDSWQSELAQKYRRGNPHPGQTGMRRSLRAVESLQNPHAEKMPCTLAVRQRHMRQMRGQYAKRTQPICFR